MRRIAIALGLLLLAGCSYTGEASRLWVGDGAGASRADRSQVDELLARALDEVDYRRERPRGGDPLLHGRLAERLHYLATFPTKLVMLTNLAEQRIMSPDPVNEQSIGRPPRLAAHQAGEEIAGLLASESGPRRLYGLALVGEQGIGAHGPRVVALLADRRVSVRHQAARVAGKYRHRPAVEGLRRMATTDADEFNRISALQALERTLGRDSVPFLQSLALRAPSPFVRAKSCGLLGRYREPQAVQALVDRLQRDREWLVRDEAATALSGLTRISIPRSAYREPGLDDELLGRLRQWCAANRLVARF